MGRAPARSRQAADTWQWSVGFRRGGCVSPVGLGLPDHTGAERQGWPQAIGVADAQRP